MNNATDFLMAAYDRMRRPGRENIRFRGGWIAAAVIPAVVLTLVYILCSVAPFGDRLLISPQTSLWFEHFERFRKALSGDGSIFYSFSGGLGGQVYSDYRDGFFSPFSLFSVFFSESGLPECLALMTITRTMFAGMFSYLLLLQFSERNEMASLAISTGYASGSLFTLSFLAPSFSDAAVFLPLIALGLALLSERGSVMPLFFGLTFFLLTVPTLWPVLALFTVIFFIWCNMIFTPQNIAARTGMLIFCVAIAVGTCAVVLVPSLAADIEQGTVLYSASGTDHARAVSVLTALIGGFIPKKGEPSPLIYASSLPALLVPVYFTTRRISLPERQTSGFFLFFILLSMAVTPLAAIFLCFSEPTGSVIAFSCAFTLLSAVMSSRLCALDSAFKTGRMLASWILVLLLFSLSSLFGGGIKLNNWIFSASFLTLTATVSLTALAGRAQKLGMYLILLFIVCFDCVAGGMISLNGAAAELPLMTKNEITIEYNDELTIINQIRANEAGRDAPFRVRGNIIDRYLCVDSPTNLTTSENQLIRALGINGKDGYSPVTDALLGIRYIVLDHSENNYTLLGMNHNQYLYYNPSSLPLAYPADRTVLKLSTYSTNPFVSQNLLLTAAAGAPREVFSDSQITFQTGHGCSITNTTSGVEVIRSAEKAYVEYRVLVPTDGALYMYMDEKQGTFENVAVNAEQIGIKRMDCVNRLGDFKRGDEVTIYISVTGERLTLGGIWFATLSQSLTDASVKEIAQRPVVCRVSRSRMDITAVMSESQLLLTTIPWTSGWSVTVDGVHKQTICAAGSFLAVETGAGTHTVAFEYIPSDFTGALIISILSFFLALAFMLIVEIRRHREESTVPSFAPSLQDASHYPPVFDVPIDFAPPGYASPDYPPEPNSDIIPELLVDDDEMSDEYGYFDNDDPYDPY